jgi:hypothetical protein
MYGWWMSLSRFELVQPPPFSLNAPTRISPAGRNRKRSA